MAEDQATNLMHACQVNAHCSPTTPVTWPRWFYCSNRQCTITFFSRRMMKGLYRNCRKRPRRQEKQLVIEFAWHTDLSTVPSNTKYDDKCFILIVQVQYMYTWYMDIIFVILKILNHPFLENNLSVLDGYIEHSPFPEVTKIHFRYLLVSELERNIRSPPQTRAIYFDRPDIFLIPKINSYIIMIMYR